MMIDNLVTTIDTGLADVPVCTSDVSCSTVDSDGNPLLTVAALTGLSL
jgi:hypothetical protein